MRRDFPQEVIGGRRAPVRSVAMVSIGGASVGQRLVETTVFFRKFFTDVEFLYHVGCRAEYE